MTQFCTNASSEFCHHFKIWNILYSYSIIVNIINLYIIYIWVHCMSKFGICMTYNCYNVYRSCPAVPVSSPQAHAFPRNSLDSPPTCSLFPPLAFKYIYQPECLCCFVPLLLSLWNPFTSNMYLPAWSTDWWFIAEPLWISLRVQTAFLVLTIALSVWTAHFASTAVTVQSGQKWTQQIKHFLWINLFRLLMPSKLLWKHLQYWEEWFSFVTCTQASVFQALVVGVATVIFREI